MKKGFTSFHHRHVGTTGHHTRYFIITIAVAYLLAMGIVAISYVIEQNFFN